MTIKKLLEKNKELDQLDVELLLSHALGKSREFVVTYPEFKLSFCKFLKFKWYINKRKRGVQVAYITGHKEFYGLDFLVNRYTLIPRPDSEVLVEVVVERGTGNGERVTLIDVGVGSGCIPISILKTMKPSNTAGRQFNNLTMNCFATDISKKALEIARENAKRHNVEIEFLYGNLLEPLVNNSAIQQCDNVIITANLPYLTEEQFETEESIQHEPKSALVAGKGGLALYEELLNQIKKMFTAHCSLFIVFEIDPSQTSRMKELIKKYLPEKKIETKKDLCGLDRVVIIS